MSAFSRVGLVARVDTDQINESLRRVTEFLESQSVDVLMEENSARLLGSADKQSRTMDEIGLEADLLIAVGGDGNILSAGRRMAPHGVPILGINRGRLGFLADVSPDEIEERLAEVLAGEFTTEEHFLLEGEVPDRGESSTEIPSALNEVLVHSAKMPTMVEIELYVDDVFVYRQHSDGLIVSSPTGSTAYALSAGGPIMHPSLNAIALVPMFPHTLTSRPLVVPGDGEIKIVIGEETRVPAKVSFDSHQEFEIDPGESVVIRKQQRALTLVHPPGHSFYGICRSKLDWQNRVFRN